MIRLLALIALGLFFAGCNRQDQNQEAIELGNKRLKVGAFREAIRAYESALDGTAKTADVHFKIAAIYDEKLKSPLDAMHHYVWSTSSITAFSCLPPTHSTAMR